MPSLLGTGPGLHYKSLKTVNQSLKHKVKGGRGEVLGLIVKFLIINRLDCDVLLACRPLMVSTQRLTSLAYNIVDGRSDNDKLSPNIRPYVVK